MPASLSAASLRRARVLATLLPLALLPAAAGAQSAAADRPRVELATAPLSTPLPNDTGVRAGRLENGLRYFVRRNVKPEKRAELRLVIDAGSVLEEDGERGFAHLLEHMA